MRLLMRASLAVALLVIGGVVGALLVGPASIGAQTPPPPPQPVGTQIGQEVHHMSPWGDDKTEYQLVDGVPMTQIDWSANQGNTAILDLVCNPPGTCPPVQVEVEGFTLMVEGVCPQCAAPD